MSNRRKIKKKYLKREENNTVCLCEDCGPGQSKTGKDLKKILSHIPAKDFVGRIVKVPFKADYENVIAEHMWVGVLKVIDDNTLEGKLLNQPFHIDDLNIKDIVTFAKEDIEDVPEVNLLHRHLKESKKK